MQIQFDRTGGFAGIRQLHTFSSDSLSAEDQQQLAALLNSANFFDLPSVIRAQGSSADQFQYKISIQTEQASHTIQFDESAMPSQLAPLLEWLKSAAASNR